MKLDYEQRQEAAGLVSRVVEDPDWAAYEIVGLAARVREMETALRPFVSRPDVIKHGALSRGLASEYAQHLEKAITALGPTRRDA